MNTESHPKLCVLLGNRADFILTNVPRSIPFHELCPFKAVNQLGQQTSVPTMPALPKSSLPPTMPWSFLHNGCAPPGEEDMALKNTQSLRPWKKLTATTKKVPGYFPLQGWEEERCSQQILLILLAVSIYKRNIAMFSVAMSA